MHIIIRKTLFFFFVTFFIVSAPLMVLYTAGFRYNFENGSIVRTGVLSVSSSPRNVSLFVDGKDIEKTTPYVVKYLIPGSYQLRLEREGYHAWEGEIDVYTSETTFVQDILLFRNEDPELIFETEVDFLSPSPNNSSVAYQVQEQGWSEIWLYELDSGLQRLIDRFLASETESIFLDWSSDGGYLLAESDIENIVQIYKADGQIIEINEDVLLGVQTAFWHPSDDQLLYIATEDELRQYDLQNKTTKTFDDADVATVLLDASTLTFIDNGTQIELRQIIADEYSVLALLPQASYRVVERDDSFVLILDESNTLFLVDIHADRPILLQTSVTVFDWQEDKDELLYSDGYEINVYNPHSHTFRFITRQSVPIDGLKWHASGESILVSTNGNLLAIEKQKKSDNRVVTTLASGLDIQSFWTSNDGKYIYFYGTVDEVTGLYELRLTR